MNNSLLKILYCPECKNDLKNTKKSFICKTCKTNYPIIEGIQILLTKLNQEQSDVQKVYEKQDVAKNFGLKEEYTGSVKYRNILRKKVANIICKKTKSKGIIVDIGCGNGLLIKEINKRRKDLQIIGIDFSLQMVLQAKEYADKNKIDSLFIVASADNLPIKNNQANASICIDVLHHFADRSMIKKSISEFIRIIKKDSISLIELKVYSRLDKLISLTYKTLVLLNLKKQIKKTPMKGLTVNKISKKTIIKELKKYNVKWQTFKVHPLLNWIVFKVKK